MDTAVKGENVKQVEASAGRAGMQRRTLLVALAAVALIVGVICGVRWWTIGRFIESTDDAYLQADSVTIAPKVSGYVAEVFVTDNQAVSAAEPLVRLDSRQYQAILEQAKATIAARKADIERGAAELLQQQANIAQARAQLQGARSNEAHALEEVKRYEPLVLRAPKPMRSSPICVMRSTRRRLRSPRTPRRYWPPSASLPPPRHRSTRHGHSCRLQKPTPARRSSTSRIPWFAAPWPAAWVTGPCAWVNSRSPARV